MGMILHMMALRSAPTQCLGSFSPPHSRKKPCPIQTESHAAADMQTRIMSIEIIEVWNSSMRDASINDDVSARFVAISKSSTSLQTPCIHSSLCFAFSLRLLFDNRATEALDICEFWLQDLEKTRMHHSESFVWYKVGLLACKALACSILSQGMKARQILKATQDELEMYNLPGLRAYISFIGLMAAGALCHKRQGAEKNTKHHTASIWTNPHSWKTSAVMHALHFHPSLVPVISASADINISDTNADIKAAISQSGDRLHKRRLSNAFEDIEVRERETFLKNTELMNLLANQHASLVAALSRMSLSSPAELIESKCVFADLWEHMLSWKSELDHVIVSVSVQKQQL
jgi:hypothetical protein